MNSGPGIKEKNQVKEERKGAEAGGGRIPTTSPWTLRERRTGQKSE